MAKPLELLLKRFSFFENSCFFLIFNSPARPSAEFGLVDLRKLVVFLRFSNRSRDPLRSFAWSNRSRCGAALPKPLPSQWDLHQISCELETIAKPWELLLKRFSPSTSARLNSALLARLNLLRQTLAMKLSTQELYFRSFLRPNPRSCG